MTHRGISLLILVAMLLVALPLRSHAEAEAYAVNDAPPAEPRKPLKKAALYLSLVAGGRVGIELFPNKGPKWRNFLNLDVLTGYMADADADVAVLTFEIRRARETGFYPVFTGGFSYVFFVPATPESCFGQGFETVEDASNFVLPCIAAGIGYQKKTSSGDYFFVELDWGFKFMISSICVGYM
ncbi:MAG: hypothetical protein ACP5F3_08275, partial [Candidatus Syntrophosphaera sp.]